MNLPIEDIEYALKKLLLGQVVAIPTETVYGLAADALNPSALAKIYAIKGRPAHNPLIIHIPSLDAISDWAIDIPNSALKVAEVFWPGPLTLILKRHSRVPDIITAKQDTVAIRIPNHPFTLQLLQMFQGGLAAPSANRSGRISPTSAEDVRLELGDKVDYILDGGPCEIGIESTIVSFVHDTPQILRQGSITQSHIQKVLGKSLFSETQPMKIHYPGQSISHYAPEKPLFLFDSSNFMDSISSFIKSENYKTTSVGIMSFLPKDSDFTHWITLATEPKLYAQMLYQTLRRLDQFCDCILVEMPPHTESWLAIRDRLQRAASPNQPNHRLF